MTYYEYIQEAREKEFLAKISIEKIKADIMIGFPTEQKKKKDKPKTKEELIEEQFKPFKIKQDEKQNKDDEEFKIDSKTKNIKFLPGKLKPAQRKYWL